ncbi:MAG: hypothetical protein AAF903_08780 [Pseudomonadota bacterium]
MMVGGISTLGRLALAIIVLALLVWAWLSFRTVALDDSLLAPSVAYETAVRDGVFERSRLVPGQRYEADDDRFRILPLYSRLRGRVLPRSRRETAHSERDQSPRPMANYMVRRKARGLETLLIAPKWRWGVAKNAQLHPALLVERQRPSFLIGTRNVLPFFQRDASWGEPIKITTNDKRFAALDGRAFVAHNLQTLSVRQAKPYCEPVVTAAGGMLLGHCTFRRDRNAGKRFWLLTDPDLLNNLGMGFGDNAAIARDLLTALAAKRKVILDTTTTYSGPDGRTRRKGPDLSELLQYLAPPYTGIWIAAGVLLLLMIWHALRRSGPLRAGDPGRLTAPGQTSRATTIAADASLMAASTTARDGHELARLRMDQGLEDLALALHLRDQDATNRASKNALSTAWPRLRQRLANIAPEELAEIESIRAAAENKSGDVLTLMDRFQSVIATLHPHFQNKARP